MSRLMTKLTKWFVRPAKTQISLGIRSVWSEPSLTAWRKLRSLATHWAHSEDSDQIGRMPKLIWVFAGRTVILLVLSWGSSSDSGSDWSEFTYNFIFPCSILMNGQTVKNRAVYVVGGEIYFWTWKTFEQDKTNCAPNGNSDQINNII